MALGVTMKPIAASFDCPDKSKLEAWISTELCLESVISTLRKIEAMLLNSSPVRREIAADSIELQALFTFAIVKYFRCFGSGRGATVDVGSVPSLTKAQRNLHENLRVLRNLHVAHAVSFEHEGTSVMLMLDAKTRKPLGFYAVSVTLASDGLRNVRRFISLVEKVNRFVGFRKRQIGDILARRFFGHGATWEMCQFKLEGGRK